MYRSAERLHVDALVAHRIVHCELAAHDGLILDHREVENVEDVEGFTQSRQLARCPRAPGGRDVNRVAALKAPEDRPQPAAVWRAVDATQFNLWQLPTY